MTLEILAKFRPYKRRNSLEYIPIWVKSLLTLKTSFWGFLEAIFYRSDIKLMMFKNIKSPQTGQNRSTIDFYFQTVHLSSHTLIVALKRFLMPSRGINEVVDYLQSQNQLNFDRKRGKTRVIPQGRNSFHQSAVIFSTKTKLKNRRKRG